MRIAFCRGVGRSREWITRNQRQKPRVRTLGPSAHFIASVQVRDLVFGYRRRAQIVASFLKKGSVYISALRVQHPCS